MALSVTVLASLGGGNVHDLNNNSIHSSTAQRQYKGGKKATDLPLRL
jgi:hypothetical protein